jgi:hypothetical protein
MTHDISDITKKHGIKVARAILDNAKPYEPGGAGRTKANGKARFVSSVSLDDFYAYMPSTFTVRRSSSPAMPRRPSAGSIMCTRSSPTKAAGFIKLARPPPVPRRGHPSS